MIRSVIQAHPELRGWSVEETKDRVRHNFVYGAYSNHARTAISCADDGDAQPATDPSAERDIPDFSREARSAWGG
jgi:hypothetical protein